MAQEIVITSVPRGVRPGRTGFQIAMRTAGMRDDVCSQLESLGVYRHMPPGGGPNPTCYFHKIVQTGAGAFSVLGRIVDAGADYSSRSNKLTHLIVIPQSEVATLTATSPAASLLAIESRLVSQWAGAPEERSHPFSLSGMPPSGPRVCVEWQRLAGDAGWGGVVAERAMAQKPVLLVAPDSSPEWCQRILRLFDEASSLIPPTRRWSISFDTTVFTSAGVTLRGTYAGSPESNARQPGLLVIDLANPVAIPGEYHGSAHVATARSGVAPQTRYKQPSQPPQQATTPQQSSSPLQTDEFGFPVEPGRTTPPQLPRSPAAESDLDTDTAAKKAKRPRTTRSGGSRDGGNHVYEKTNHWQAPAVMVVLVVLLLAGVLTGYYLTQIKLGLDKIAAENADAEKAAADKAAPDKPEADKPEADKPEADKAAADKAAADKAAADKAAADRAALVPLPRSTTNDSKARANANQSVDQSLRKVGSIVWPKPGERTVLVEGLSSPEHLSPKLYLPHPKHDLEWFPTVTPDSTKLEWKFRGVPGDANKQWGRVFVNNSTADTGKLIFEREKDCPDLCSFIPFVIATEHTATNDSATKDTTPHCLAFDTKPRPYTLLNPTSRLSELVGDSNQPERQNLLAEMPGIVLQSFARDNAVVSCTLVGRSTPNDNLHFRWIAKKGPSYVSYVTSYGLYCTTPDLLSLSKDPPVDHGTGDKRTPLKPGVLAKVISDEEIELDDFIDIVVYVITSTLGESWTKDRVSECVYLNKKDTDDLERYRTTWQKPSAQQGDIWAKVETTLRGSNDSFIKAKATRSLTNLTVEKCTPKKLATWYSLVRTYAAEGCRSRKCGDIQGSQSAQQVLSAQEAWVKEHTKGQITADTKLVVALYLVANLDSVIRATAVLQRQPSKEPEKNYSETQRIDLFGPKGEVLLEWTWPDKPPGVGFECPPVAILKVVPHNP